MTKSPKECLEKWAGTELQIQSGSGGCCLVLNNVTAGLSKNNPLSKPLVNYPDQREILIAIVLKAGGKLKI